MSENPLEIIENTDVEFFRLLEKTRENALSNGAMPLKYKLLIAMALDAAAGAADGMKVLALEAISAGATKEEVMETVRITQYIAGVGSVYTAAYALKDVL